MSEIPPVAYEARRPFLQSLSIIWVIPFLALAVTLVVAWQAYSERGPLITIAFEDGAGVLPRQTELRFRDVRVGIVEDLTFSDDLSSVVATVRVDRKLAPFIDSGASFWIVRPELSTSGVSGLDTVLTGVFIEGVWDNDPGPPRSAFNGLSRAPLFRPDRSGLQFALRSVPGGILYADTPILFRGIEIGRVGPATISPEGNFAIAEAIIYEPHERLVTSSTRFWDTSGFSVSIGAAGAQVDFNSIASLVTGGITFDTFVSGGAVVGDGAVFEVYPSEADARNSVFNVSEVETLELRAVFDDNISGLALGAPVEFSGVRVGSVESVSGLVDHDAFGDNRVRLNVVLGIQPSRLGLQDEVSPESALRFLQDRVTEGLRARLTNGNLLTGGLKIEMVEIETAPPDEITLADGAIPVVPTSDSVVADTAATVEGVFTRINNLPIEDLLLSAIGFMESAQNLIASDDVRGTPEALRDLLAEINRVVTSQTVQDIPVTLNAALMRLDGILAQIEEEQAVARMLAALDATTQAAATVGGSVDGVPALIDELTQVAARAATLPLDELTAELTQIVRSAETLLSAPGTQAVPEALAGALDELNATLAELRSGGAVTNVNATLVSTREAADAVALSTRDLPQLVDRITQVFDEASATIRGYNRGETLSRDAQAALRDISEASAAIASLARLLERNPNALIRGR